MTEIEPSDDGQSIASWIGGCPDCDWHNFESDLSFNPGGPATVELDCPNCGNTHRETTADREDFEAFGEIFRDATPSLSA